MSPLSEISRFSWLMRLLVALGRSFCAGCCVFWTPYPYLGNTTERATGSLALWHITQARRWFDEKS